MAYYKYSKYLVVSNSAEFDTVHNPGANTPFSGIYKCTGCGHEIVSEENNPFPPQNHHQHKAAQGAIKWKLTEYADHASKTI